MPPKNSKHLLCISYFKFKYEHKNKIAIPIIKHAQSILPSQYHVNKETTTTIHDTFVLFATACPNKKPIHTYNSDLLTDHNKNMPIYNKYKKISLKEW